MTENVLADEILENCVDKMKVLSEEKLKLIQALLMTM